MDCLKKYVEDNADIDFILHGGDMVDETSEAAIYAASEFFGQLSCPTYLALGNHDLMLRNSLELWLRIAPQFFPDRKSDFRLVKDGVRLDGALCNWGDEVAYWDPDKPQIPWLTNEQLKRISEPYDECRTQIIVTHAPIYGLPPEQYGGWGPLHPPIGEFSDQLSEAGSRACLILGAHNHMNMAVRKSDRYHVTTAALSESPFEFKVIDATRDKMVLRTISLNSKVSFQSEYDFESTYVQGRACDRHFTMELS